MLAVEARDLRKTFKSGWRGQRRTEALRGASLQVPAGPSTASSAPTAPGRRRSSPSSPPSSCPTAAPRAILGHDVVREATAIRRRLNMASGNASFVWSLRPSEVLTFYGGLYGLHGKVLRDRVEMLIEQCELGPHRKTEYNALSTGLKQRLALAKALINEPEVLFLDEPTLGLDPDISIRLRAQIASLRRERGTTIILTTHYMREAEELCDRIAFIKAGASWPRARPTSSSARSASGTSSPSASSRGRPWASPIFPACSSSTSRAITSSARWTPRRSAWPRSCAGCTSRASS